MFLVSCFLEILWDRNANFLVWNRVQAGSKLWRTDGVSPWRTWRWQGMDSTILGRRLFPKHPKPGFFGVTLSVTPQKKIQANTDVTQMGPLVLIGILALFWGRGVTASENPWIFQWGWRWFIYLWVKRPIFKGELLGSRSVYVRKFEPLDENECQIFSRDLEGCKDSLVTNIPGGNKSLLSKYVIYGGYPKYYCWVHWNCFFRGGGGLSTVHDVVWHIIWVKPWG